MDNYHSEVKEDTWRVFLKYLVILVMDKKEAVFSWFDCMLF